MHVVSVRRSAGLLLSALALAALSASAVSQARAQLRGVLMYPSVSEYEQISASATPPTEAQCFADTIRCFGPQAMRAAYNLGPLYAQGVTGTGFTIAIVDSYGSDTMAHDLHVYDQAFGVAPLCGEEGVTCTPGMPWFRTFSFQGSPATKAPPSTSKSPGQEDKSAWALETSLDVETAHAMAPGANILLVTTPTAETLGVQGYPDMMNAEQYVIDHHMADVISQSFGAAEDSFASPQSLLNLRHAYISAAQNGVTVLASSGDDGSAGVGKAPVGKGGTLLPNPTVGWPASDPLVTGVGGTYLCTDPSATSARVLDNVDPPTKCQNQSQDEIGWIDAGGGYSHIFSRPSYQDTLPAGSTPIPQTARGVPDIAFEASARTGPLIYVTLPPDGSSGLSCGSAPCSAGWYVIGGTSVSCPHWAGLIALADQINGGDLGLINPALYRLASDPSHYASDYFDVTTGNNGAFAPTVPAYFASTGWDPVTGLGTPNAANLLPDLVAASH